MTLFNSMMLIFYANVVMALILDVSLQSLSRKKRLVWLVYTAVIAAVSVLFLFTIGQPTYGKVYVLLVQFPLYVQFLTLSRYRGVKVLFALLSTIIFAAPPIMCVTALRIFFHIGPAVLVGIYFLGYTVVALFIYRFLKSDFNYMLEHCESAQFWIFCAIPVLHYIYAFATTKYDFLQDFDASGYWIRQLPTIIVFVSYILLIRVFRSARETQRLQNEASMNHIQMDAAAARLQELNRAQEQTRRYRHDMRHHLTLLQAMAAEGDLARISEYLRTARSDLDSFTPTRYCANETTSLLLSSFEGKAKQAGVALSVDARLPEDLPLSETELCSLLSNSLENAVTAAAQVTPPGKRTVTLRTAVYQGKLLLSVENTYAGEVSMQGGLPQTTLAGHGYGTRSIAAIAERHGGQALFSADGGVFSLKVLLPLSGVTDT